MLKNMYHVILFCLWSLFGVFGEFVSVMEGDSVTLSVSLNETQREDRISWKFTSQEIKASEIIIAETEDKGNTVSLHDDRAEGRFRDRLKLDHTGSLTITNTNITHTGLYQVNTIRTNTQLKTINLTVSARLPVPVITSIFPQNSSSSSSSNCSLLCSVLNMRDVSLSWYKGNSLLSIISVSDLNNNISLHLKCLDDSYSCVLNNTISSQTQHLNTDLCQTCSENNINSNNNNILISSATVVGCLIIAAVLIFCICRKRQNIQQQDQTCKEIIYADTTFHKRNARKMRSAVEDDVVYAGVMRQ